MGVTKATCNKKTRLTTKKYLEFLIVQVPLFMEEEIYINLYTFFAQIFLKSLLVSCVLIPKRLFLYEIPIYNGARWTRLGNLTIISTLALLCLSAMIVPASAHACVVKPRWEQ